MTKMTIEATTRLVCSGGQPVGRIWEGMTDAGVPVVVLVAGIAVDGELDCSEFEHVLIDLRPPSAIGIDAFPSMP
jgi:hypothetical protein